jgi:hypothetical protein
MEDYQDQISEVQPAMQATATAPLEFNPADFGEFADAWIEVDQSKQMAKLVTPLRNHVTISVRLPVPLLVAWTLNDPAGRLLVDAGKLKA